jgi:hypothetical protein
MRERTIVIAIIVAMCAAVASPANAATRDASAEERSLQLVNQERRARGIAALQLHSRMTSIARQHSARMAADGELRHNDNLPDEVGPFRALGENVGYGADAEDVHAAFMGSSSHRHAILAGKYTHVGIGVIRDGELAWITQVFYTPDAEARRTTVTRSEPTVERQRSTERTVRRSGPRLVRAQAGEAVRPVRAHRAPARRAPRLTRTLAMLEVMASIDREIAPRRFVASPPVWA